MLFRSPAACQAQDGQLAGATTLICVSRIPIHILWTAFVVFRLLHLCSQIPSSVVCFSHLFLRKGGACKERSREHQQGAVRLEGCGAAPAFGIHAVTAARWTTV